MRTFVKIGLVAIATSTFAATPGDAVVYPGVRFIATLAGGTTGDPDGHGTAYVWADKSRNRICAAITVRNIQLPASSYIRVRTWSGQLTNMTTAQSNGCMISDENTAPMIAALLSGRYMSIVGINNAQYGRALYGNLKRG